MQSTGGIKYWRVYFSTFFIPIFSFSLLNFSYSLLTKQKSLPSLLRDERPIICLTRYHSFSWRNSMHSSDTRQQSLSLYPARITAGNPSASTFFIGKFGAATLRRVPLFPSAAFHQPATLCDPVGTYYSSSSHFRLSTCNYFTI